MLYAVKALDRPTGILTDMPGRITSSAFIGRQVELESLLEVFGATLDGPAVVLLGGEAGIGKTRLVSEFAGHISEARVLVGACLELGEAVMPYLPLAGILRQLSRKVGPEETRRLYGAELTRFLPDQGSSSVDSGEREQSGLFEAVLALLGRLAETSSVVVVMEDLHWADRSTLDLLSFLARNLGSMRVMLVGTYRSDEMRRTHALRPVLAELSRLPLVQRIELQPMDEDEVLQLFTAIRGNQPQPEEAVSILTRSEGNPFYVEELVAAGDPARVGMPSSLRDILADRLDNLPESAKEVLRIAAAAGRRVDHRLLEVVAQLPEDDLQAGLRAAVDGEALVPDAESHGYRFRHALLQEAAHDQLLPGERTRLHRAFVNALQADPSLAAGGRAGVHAELAYHALAAHDVDLAFSSLVRAGQRARDLFAFAEARQHFERAAELRPQVGNQVLADAPPTWELLRNAALCARYSGDSRGAAVSHLRRAIGVLGEDNDPVSLGGLWAELSESYWMAGLSDEAAAASDRSVGVLGHTATRERAEALGWRSRLFMLLGRYHDAIPPGMEAVDLARRIDARRELSRALNSLGCSLALVGREEGLSMLREAIEVADRIDAATDALRGYNNLASCLRIPLDDLAQAVEVFSAGLDYASRKGVRGPIVDWIRLEGAEVLLRLGRWQDVARIVGQVRTGAASGATGRYHEIVLAIQQVTQGRYDEAEQHLQRADEIAPSIRDPQAIAPMIGVRMRLMLARNNFDTSEAIQRIEPMIADPIIYPVVPLIARVEAAAALLGHDRDARNRIARFVDQLRQVRDSAEGYLARNAGAWLSLTEAELSRARGEVAPELWREALLRIREMTYAEHELYAQLRLAEALAAGSETADAEVELVPAYQRARSLGAMPLVEEMETLARRARLKLPAMAPIAADVERGLTGREREVLVLVAQGRTNREIGENLFISEKTASVHVSNIMAKLGAANRTEAGAKARALGLDRL
jgi:DNA-binding CsgD family transcriptional regulator